VLSDSTPRGRANPAVDDHFSDFQSLSQKLLFFFA
jgi:hypothetical protein